MVRELWRARLQFGIPIPPSAVGVLCSHRQAGAILLYVLISVYGYVQGFLYKKKIIAK